MQECFEKGFSHFLEMSNGNINQTEIVAALINQKESIVEGLKFVQEMINGSMTVLVMTDKGVYCSETVWPYAGDPGQKEEPTVFL